MQGGEQQVPGQGGLDGDRGRLPVADLAHHDDLRVLPQQAAQPAGEVELGPGPGLRLRDPRQRPLDRVLDRDDVPAAVVGHDLPQAGVDGRRLAAAARPGQEHRPGPRAQQPVEAGAHVGGEAELVQVEQTGRRVEHADDSALAVDRREGADAAVGAAGRAGAPLLRDVGAVRQQLGHHLQPGDDVRRHLARQRRERPQHAVDPYPHGEGVGGRLEVDVAGPESVGLREQQIDGADDAIGAGPEGGGGVGGHGGAPAGGDSF